MFHPHFLAIFLFMICLFAQAQGAWRYVSYEGNQVTLQDEFGQRQNHSLVVMNTIGPSLLLFNSSSGSFFYLTLTEEQWRTIFLASREELNGLVFDQTQLSPLVLNALISINQS